MKKTQKLSIKVLFISIFLVSFLSQAKLASAEDLCRKITGEIACLNGTGCAWTASGCITNLGGKASNAMQEADPLKGKFTTPAEIINSLLPYLLTAAGLILFAMLIMGGFTMLTAISDPKKAEAGKQTITTAIVGFLIMFLAYWLTQILEIILGITIF